MMAASVLWETNWRWIALRAVAALLFGVVALLWPGVTVYALVILFGAYALVDGAFTIVAAFTQGRRGWNALAWILAGLLGIAAGVVTFAWPGITALALLYVIAFWALVTGVLEIAAAISLRREIPHEWMLVLTGLLSIALGVVLLAVHPVAGILGIVWAIGWFALFASGVLAAEAWQLHRIQKGGVPRTRSSWTPGPGPAPTS